MARTKKKTSKRKGVGGAPVAGATSPAESALAQVRKLLNASDYAGAEAVLTEHWSKLEKSADAQFFMARVHWMHHRPKLSEQAAQRAVDLAPDVAKYHNELGLAKRGQNRYFEASMDFLRAIRLQPTMREVLNNLATNYIDIGDSRGALACFEAILEHKADYSSGFSNMLFTMNYVDGKPQSELYAAAVRFAERYVNPQRKPAYESRRVDPDPGRRLRVGFVSADLRDHPVAQFLLPLAERLDRDQFELAFYSNAVSVKATAQTARFKACTELWREAEPLSDDALVRQIVRDRIDILIDVSGHTAGNRLPALGRKPAPVQVTWLGYPNTTGIAAIDYRVSDEIVEPGFGVHTAERPALLADGFHCYRPTEGSPEVAPTPALANGHVTFGSLNNLAKVTPKCFRMWAAILNELPDAQLIMKARGVADSGVRERIWQNFEERGVARDRIRFLDLKASKADHLAMMSDIDIALDSAPYTGTTTTCDCLWMGVPVITMLGDTPAARVSASLMHRVGLEPLVAVDEENYVKNAVELASDVGRLADLRQAIRPAFEASALRDEPGFARKFGTMLREIWHAWCAEQGADVPKQVPEAGVSAPPNDLVPPVEPAVAQAETADPHIGTNADTDVDPDVDPDQVRVLHHMARTGGTLISKCLGAMDGVVLLSEAHPHGLQMIDAVAQAQDWFGLIDAGEAAQIRASRTPFEDLIALTNRRCAESGRRLVVRDWTHLDYTGVPFVKKPRYRLTTAACLAERFGKVSQAVTVRHPVDQWLSLNRLAIMQGRLSVRDYLRGYRKFAETAAELGFLRYEDFTAEPGNQLQRLCARLDLPFDPGYAERWADYHKITGDVNQSSAGPREIRPGRAKAHDPELVETFESYRDYHAALELLGYAPAERKPASGKRAGSAGPAAKTPEPAVPKAPNGAPGGGDFGILVTGFARPVDLGNTLESLRLQGEIGRVHVWIDGSGGRKELGRDHGRCVELAKRYEVAEVRAHSGNLGSKKLILDALTDMAGRYARFAFFEDDCFPTRDSVATFRTLLEQIADDPEVFSVYGHHFGVPKEGQTITRFQGWGWGSTSAKLQPYLEELRACYMMNEQDYTDWVQSQLTPKVLRRLDVTPGRDCHAVARFVYSWDSCLALLTARDERVHMKTPQRTVYNCGLGGKTGHFDDNPQLREPPFNMIAPDEVWSVFDPETSRWSPRAASGGVAAVGG